MSTNQQAGQRIDEAGIAASLEAARQPNPGQVRELIKKARECRGLSVAETAVLLQNDDPALMEELFIAARAIKETIYGRRVVFFAPLYVSNICGNNCLYCAFRRDNRDLKRCRLSPGEVAREVAALEEQGHKRLLVVAGEDPSQGAIEYLEQVIAAVYATRKGKGAIRRVNVNVAPLSIDDFKRLKATGIGTFQLFQETYHRPTYARMHPSGPKRDYDARLTAIDHAVQAGIDDVGIGALFGLYDYRFEVLALLQHSLHLEQRFGVGPHTISVPRLKHAQGAPAAAQPPCPVSDEEFKKLVAIIRLAVPYTGMILSTRESSALRDEVLRLGISQMSAGSRTNPGAYGTVGEHFPDAEQFHLEDTRTLREVVVDITRAGFYPSFCTACYRLGRTGKNFMELAKPGDIKDFCTPNCLLTFKEYVLDYGDEELRGLAAVIINRELAAITTPAVRKVLAGQLARLDAGERDLYI